MNQIGVSKVVAFCFLVITFSLDVAGQNQKLSMQTKLDEIDTLIDVDSESARVKLDSIAPFVLDQDDPDLTIFYHKLNGDFFLTENLYNEAVEAYAPLLTFNTRDLGREISLKLAKAINDLGIAYMKVGNLDDAISAHIQSVKIYDRYNDPQGGSYNYNNIAIIYKNLKKIDSALYFHQRSLEYAVLAKDTMGIGFNHFNMAVLYADNKDPLLALENFEKSLLIFEQQGNVRMINSLKRRLGSYYSRIGDNESALAIFRDVLAYYQEQESKMGLGGSHVAIAEFLLKLDESDTALYHIQKGIEFYEPTGYTQGLAKAYNLAGLYHRKKGDYSNALNNYQKSLEYSQGVLHGMTLSNLNGISTTYFLQGKYQSAISTAEQGLKEVNYSASPGSLASAYQTLYQSYKSLGNNQTALEYLEKWNQEKKKIFDDDRMMELARAEYQNQLNRERELDEIEQARRELAYQQELTKERLIKYGAVVVALCVAIIAFFAYRAYKIKRVANLSLQEKNQRLKELRESEKKLSEEAIYSKERELATMAMSSHEKNSLLRDLEQKVSFIESRMGDEMKGSLKEMRKTISDGYSLDKSWDSFIHRFEDVHPQFFDKLKVENPNLTVDDLKLSAYLKIGMTNKEIANVTHLTLGSVKSKINRLKKKLEMSPEDSVRDYMLKYA